MNTTDTDDNNTATGNTTTTISISMEDDDDNSQNQTEDDDEEGGGGGESDFMDDEITAQLAVSGPVGVAAAAAIASSKKRKRPYNFETNPSTRKRQHTRLLRKLKYTIDEFTTRVGQQAIVLVVTPGKQQSYKVFGAKPLENVLKDFREIIMTELENALASQTPLPTPDDPTLFELPPLTIDGIPTPVEKMTQAQLRAFIPLMLRFSTGRGKPGWGRESTRPPWWPADLPWSNVRMDARTSYDKAKRSWTQSLREVVMNCYKYHGREDLFPSFSEMINLTIKNVDGSISSHQVDPNNPYITLPDGTKASIQGLDALQKSNNGCGGSATNISADVAPNNNVDNNVTDITDNSDEIVATTTGGDNNKLLYQMNSVTEATINSQGQIILTADDGRNYPVSTANGLITLPIGTDTSLFQSMIIDNVSNSDGGNLMCVSKIDNCNRDLDEYNGQSVVIQTSDENGDGQLYRVITLGEGGLTNGYQIDNVIKTEEQLLNE